MRIWAFSTLASAVLFIAGMDVTPLPAPKPEPWKELTCDVGSPVVLSAGENVKDVTWKLIDDAGGATLTAPPDSVHAVFVASKPGRYRFACIADGKASWTVMQAGDVPPGPPPGPGPTPPKPVDDLTKALQAAYTADAGPTKAADLRQLIALYQQAVEFARDDKTLTSAADLFARVSGAAATLLPDDPTTGLRRLAGVRKVIAGELAGILPTDPDAPLTDAVRQAAATAFAKYAKALQGVVP